MSTAKKRVLVVDDQVSMRKRLRDLLETLGCEVSEAEDGIVALKNVEAMAPDLVISDIHMPGLDGLKLTQALRRRAHDRQLPVLLLTAQSGPAAVAQAANAGAFSYLSKPIYRTELERALERVFPTPRRAVG